MLRDLLTAGWRPLTPSMKVRLLLPEPAIHISLSRAVDPGSANGRPSGSEPENVRSIRTPGTKQQHAGPGSSPVFVRRGGVSGSTVGPYPTSASSNLAFGSRRNQNQKYKTTRGEARTRTPSTSGDCDALLMRVELGSIPREFARLHHRSFPGSSVRRASAC